MSQEFDQIDQYWQALMRGDRSPPTAPLNIQGSATDELSDQLHVLDLLFAARQPESAAAGVQTNAPIDGTVTPPDRPVLADGALVGGRLRVLSLLDAGGMGEVYLVRHETLDCEMALKLLPQRLANDPQVVALFHEGMKAQYQIGGHTHIVSTIDAGEHQGRLYVVMEYVPGINLGKYVQRHGPLSWQTACEVIRQATLGLEHAHRLGVIHRDIKPSNLMLDVQGHVKILDWGLAWLKSIDAGVDATARPTAVGTFDYIAPQQATDPLAAGPASDLYSLGATLFFLLTGQAPFAHYRSDREKLLAHQSQSPAPVSRLRRGTPRDVDRLIARLMSKSPQDRFATARDVTDAVKRILAGRQIQGGIRATDLVMAVLIALVVLAVSFQLWTRSDRAPLSDPRSQPTPATPAPALTDADRAPALPRQIPRFSQPPTTWPDDPVAPPANVTATPLRE